MKLYLAGGMGYRELLFGGGNNGFVSCNARWTME